MKKALILGVTGQDGSYCADLLLEKKYKVYGMVRKSSTTNTKNIDHLIEDHKLFNKSFFIKHGDMLDHVALDTIINDIKPDEIYNFADQDHVGWSYQIPTYSFNVTTNSVMTILEILRKQKKKIKYFQPISSNIFGHSKGKKFNENSIMDPHSIYALGKASTYMLCRMYKKLYNLKIYGAIFFNHESPKRSAEYVSQKIIKHACEIAYKKRKYLYLGDVNSKIDWGYAKDYVFYSWKIMQKSNPDFYIIATGKINSVRDFVTKVFKKLNLDINTHLRINKSLLRPFKSLPLTANISKAQKELGYNVANNLDSLIDIMLGAELKKYNA